jgi:hypothetical protein
VRAPSIHSTKDKNIRMWMLKSIVLRINDIFSFDCFVNKEKAAAKKIEELQEFAEKAVKKMEKLL